MFNRFETLLIGPEGKEAILSLDRQGNLVCSKPFIGGQTFSEAPSTIQTSGLLGGIGSSSSLFTKSDAGKNFLQYYLETTATSGDTRGLYMRLYLSGAGVSGEAIRGFTTINNKSVAVGGTVNGAHISLGLTGANAAISGQGFGLRVDFEADATVGAWGGSQSAVALFETNIESGPTIPSDFAFLRLNNLGAQKADLLASITNPSTTMFATAGTGVNSAGVATGGVAAKVLKVIVDGVAYWLPLFSSNA